MVIFMNNKISKGLMVLGLAVPVLALAAFRTYTPVAGAESGPKVGGEVYAFEPTHVTGPDKGTDTCPVCKYGSEPAAQVWVNGDDPANLAKITKTLEGAIAKNGLHKFRAFVVVIPANGETPEAVKSNLTEFAAKNGLKDVALTYVRDNDAISEYKINTDASVKNTVFVYADRTVVANYVNLKGDDEGLAKLQASIAKAVAK